MIRSLVFLLLTAALSFCQILPEGLGTRWWRTQQMVDKLGLTAEQQKNMDAVFQQHRTQLIDLTASLDKEEAILEPLVAADQPDPNKIRPQVARVAQARSALEIGNADMLLGLRLLLTPGQWRKLQDSSVAPRFPKAKRVR
jgi:Spy/CpxP family protein refolding chaperone